MLRWNSIPGRKPAGYLLGWLLIAWLIPALAGCQTSPSTVSGAANETEDSVTIVTWNVRGYPERDAPRQAWFTQTLTTLNADVLCIQEIANQQRVNTFLEREPGYTRVAFQDSQNGQDNAIFLRADIGFRDPPDPEGFLHPAQAAYVWRGGFDAVIVTVHLAWTDTQRREEEKILLHAVAQQMLSIDPDLIIAGDFNTTESGIDELARSLGMLVMIPAGQDGVGTTHAGNRYDHFLLSPDLAGEEAIRCRIWTVDEAERAAARDVSDHLPVTAAFATDRRFQDRA